MAIQFNAVDFTNILPKNKGDILFNPSLSYWKDDLYVCIYREFTRYKGVDNTDFDKDPITDFQHPWLGGDKSSLYWYPIYGYDKSKIVLLSIDNTLKVKLVKDFGNIKGVDARILKISENTFITTYNIKIESDIIIKNNKNCTNGCMLIEARLLNISDNGKDLCQSDGIILCPRISHSTEKNWSLWKTTDNNIKFSYNISPYHEVFDLELSNKDIQCTSVKKISTTHNFFKNLENYYKGLVKVSCSTPAFLMKDAKTYISIGHIKYEYSKIYTDTEVIETSSNYNKSSNKRDISVNTNLAKFTNKMYDMNKKFHPTLVYLMFLYEFEDTPPYKIVRISDMFIPESDYVLCFPTNMTYIEPLDSYIISYGDYDSRCKLLSMTSDEIENSLHNIPDPKNTQFNMI